ncbi:MAG: hypothetical protein LBU11_10415 [Zoogloeaceae bacterium]|jgi:hypothetical protein|nr:hypothetical protein [Zoogloeaceae bacterium]
MSPKTCRIRLVLIGMATACLSLLPARAQTTGEEAQIELCFNYGCLSRQTVVFSDDRFGTATRELAEARDAAEEREHLARAVGRLYALAAEQTPVGADQGGNYADAGVSGRMDCIDHSRNTSAFLHLLAERALLRWHRVLPPTRRMRFFLLQHFSAQIEETEGGGRYVVDSWFVDNGEPAVILTLEDWKRGGGPDV